MNASAPSVPRLEQNMKGIGTRHQSIHDSLWQQYLFAGSERHSRTAHDAGRADILTELRNIPASIRAHVDLDIIVDNIEIRE